MPGAKKHSPARRSPKQKKNGRTRAPTAWDEHRNAFIRLWKRNHPGQKMPPMAEWMPLARKGYLKSGNYKLNFYKGKTKLEDIVAEEADD